MARDLELVNEKDFTAFLGRIVDVRMMLYGLLKKVKGDALRAAGTGTGADNG